MTDLVAQLVGALEGLTAMYAKTWDVVGGGLAMLSDSVKEFEKAHEEARAAISAAKDGGWVDVGDCPDGDVWFALDCGHVVMGYKNGDFVDWESSVDHDCCHDASALKAQQVNAPKHPKDQS